MAVVLVHDITKSEEMEKGIRTCLKSLSTHLKAQIKSTVQEMWIEILSKLEAFYILEKLIDRSPPSLL